METTSVCATREPLLVPYADGELSAPEAARLTEHLLGCPACQHRVAQLEQLRRLTAAIPAPTPPLALRDGVLALLAAEKAATSQVAPAGPFVAVWRRPVARGWQRVAASVTLVALGALLTLLLRPAPTRPGLLTSRGSAPGLGVELATASATPATASDRLRLIRQVPSRSAPGDPVVQVLITTLNADPNPNVRLAAAEALYRLRADPGVAPALVQALPNQTDPNVQITLIELLVALRNPGAVGKLKDLTRRPDVLPVVRQQAQSGLSQLL